MSQYNNVPGNDVPVGKIVGYGLLALFVIIVFAAFISSCYVISPGERGVVVTLGKVSTGFSGEGLAFKAPFISSVVRVAVRQQTDAVKAPAFSSDLQQIDITLKVLYRIPEASVVDIYQKYAGNPFDSLITPRVQEALKEVTASETAECIVKKREMIKTKTLEASRKKIGTLLFIEDIVIENVDLSDELEKAIEAKMVQEQEAAKARFIQQKTQIEADTAIIKAKGEAEAIKIRGEAIKANPGIIELQITEKWNGVSPLVVGSSSGASILLPVQGRPEVHSTKTPVEKQ